MIKKEELLEIIEGRIERKMKQSIFDYMIVNGDMVEYR